MADGLCLRVQDLEDLEVIRVTKWGEHFWFEWPRTLIGIVAELADILVSVATLGFMHSGFHLSYLFFAMRLEHRLFYAEEHAAIQACLEQYDEGVWGAGPPCAKIAHVPWEWEEGEEE